MSKRLVSKDIEEVQARIEERLRLGIDRMTIVDELHEEYHDRSALIRVVNSVADPALKKRYRPHNLWLVRLTVLYGVFLLATPLLAPVELTSLVALNVVNGLLVLVTAIMIHRFHSDGYGALSLIINLSVLRWIVHISSNGTASVPPWLVFVVVLQLVFGIGISWYATELSRKIRPVFGMRDLFRSPGTRGSGDGDQRSVEEPCDASR